MSETANALGQPIGQPVPDWTPPPRPGDGPLVGRYSIVERLDPARHARSLFDAYAHDRDGRNWTYLPYGSFDRFDDYDAWLRKTCLGEDPKFFAVIDPETQQAIGVASYLRIDPNNGAIEVGHINFSPLLQRSRAATDALYLMADHVFALGYRRYEWKCDSLNEPSMRAARRLGFTYEGIFRQATVYKGRNRDTAWFAMIDSEWPALQRAYETWLAPGNFSADGTQKSSLSVLTANALAD